MNKKPLEPSPPDGSLVPYYMIGKDSKGKPLEPWCYNGKTVWGDSKSIFNAKDIFEINKDHGIPDRYGCRVRDPPPVVGLTDFTLYSVLTQTPNNFIKL